MLLLLHLESECQILYFIEFDSYYTITTYNSNVNQDLYLKALDTIGYYSKCILALQTYKRVMEGC